MSPIQFQKQIRLQTARVRLVLDPGDVAGVARAVGYESASQFSREYHRQFGVPPGVDAGRLRAGAGRPGRLDAHAAPVVPAHDRTSSPQEVTA
jgi:AraC-like DNA-binding protein